MAGMSAPPATAGPASGEESPRKKDGTTTYASELYSYYYNGRAALHGAWYGTARLEDNTDTFLLGRKYKGCDTTQWVDVNIAHINIFTYRKGFAPLANGATYDAGWGCMVRTGQMMLAEALKRTPQLKSMSLADLLSRFYDAPQASFSIHNMTAAGAARSIPVGQWFTATTLSRAIRQVVSADTTVQSALEVVVAGDGTVVRSDVTSALQSGRSVLLLIPLMLGIGAVSQSYRESVLNTFELPSSVGVVGGKPSHSLYFVGHQKDLTFFLDPHVVQAAFVSESTLGYPSGPRGTAPIDSWDPCLMLCFLFSVEKDFADWEAAFAVIHPKSEYPMFSVVKSQPTVRMPECSCDDDS